MRLLGSGRAPLANHLLPSRKIRVPDVPNPKPRAISLLTEDGHFLARISDRSSRTRGGEGNAIGTAQERQVGSPVKVRDAEVKACDRWQLFEPVTNRRPPLDERLAGRELPAVLDVLGGQCLPLTRLYDLWEPVFQRT